MERIRRIRAWQDGGTSLDRIKASLDSGGEAAEEIAAAVPARRLEPAMWMRLPVAPGVELGIQAGRFRISPARLEQLAEAMAELCEEIIPPLAGSEQGGSDDGSNDD